MYPLSNAFNLNEVSCFRNLNSHKNRITMILLLCQFRESRKYNMPLKLCDELKD